MATTQKAMDLALFLKDVISKQVYGTMPVVTEGFTSEGNPYLSFSADTTPATTEKVVVVVVKPYVTGTAKDVFGNTANAYVPHVIQFCTEANLTGSSGADTLTPTDLLPIICEIAKRGTFIEWHVTTRGTVPSAAAIVAGTALSATYKPFVWGIQAAV
jgi:hypothetical protein